MSTIEFHEGLILEFKDNEPCYRGVIRSEKRGKLVVVDLQKAISYEMEKSHVLSRLKDNTVKFLRESKDHGHLTFSDLPIKEQNEAARKLKYIRALENNGICKVTAKSAEVIIKQLAESLGEKAPHWQSVRNWYKKYVEAGSKLKGLFPGHKFKGRRGSRLDITVDQIIETASKGFFRPDSPTVRSIFRNVEAKILSYNMENPERPLKVPTYLTVRNRLRKYSDVKSRSSRQGRQAVAYQMMDAEGPVKSERVLERVEIDHTPLAINVLDDERKTLLGRPFITILIDHYSGMVLGFQLSFEHPSFASVCMACANAFLPKDEVMSQYDVKGMWPAKGVPELLVTDNGKEFWGKDFAAVAEEIGSVFQYCPVEAPNFKSKVEGYFNKIECEVLGDLPGVIKKPGKCSKDYDPRKGELLTFSEFKKYLLDWTVGVYHNSPLERSSQTPLELWSESEDELPLIDEDEMELLPILMASKTRTLRRGGVQNFGLYYNSSLLKDLLRRDGPCTVKIRYSPFDLGYILVLDTVNKVYIKVDCIQYAYACGLSKYEHQVVRQYAREKKNGKLENSDLQIAKIELAKKREEAHARNRRRKTQVATSKAARIDQVGVDLKLVVNNSKNIISESDDNDDSLDMSGWDLE